MSDGILLYIDPGTGSMLFTILLGIVGAAVYFIRTLIIKIKYRLGAKVNIDVTEKIPLVIFAESKTYYNVFRPVCEELERREKKAVYLTSTENDPAFDGGYKYIDVKYIGKGNKAYAYLNMLNASIVLSTTPSLDVFQWKRSKKVDYYIHLPHMCSDLSLYRMFALDYYDAVLISGDFQKNQVRTLEKMRNLPEKEIFEAGIPYMDELKKRADANRKTESREKTVLLAPSWGANAILEKYGGEFIDKLIETGYHIVIRPHPQSFVSEKDMIDSLMQKYPDSDRFEWNRDADNFEILSRSDILISDFSGVIFDFALVFDKPVIYTEVEINTDPDDAAWLDETPWTYEVLPKLGQELNKENFEDIKGVIDGLIDNAEYQKGRDEARKQSWLHPGEGAVRVVDFMIKKLEELGNKEESSDGSN